MVAPVALSIFLWIIFFICRRSFLRDGPTVWQTCRCPLFPTAAGKVVSKNAMQDNILEAARLLGVPHAAPDGSERVSGHSLRVTGAQGLVLRGWDLWTVQLHGRWGSDVVKRYVRESPLTAVALGRGPAARQDLDLEAVVSAVVRELQPRVRVEPAAVQSAVCLSTAAGVPPHRERCGAT